MKLANQKGLAMVELAILLPLLLLILFGVAEFGRAWYLTNTLTNAAREGARRASISPTDPTTEPARAAVVDRISESCPFPVDPENVAITSTNSPPQHGTDTITVTISYPFQSPVPLLDMLQDITLQGEASMFYE